MEIMVPSNNDFIFDSAQSTPFVSAPSSPRPFGAGANPFDYYHYHYASAPTSPTRVAAILASSSTSFDWEEKPKSTTPRAQNPDDFAFDFSGQLEKGTDDLTAADELFEKGKIRPLKPPPRAYNEKSSNMASSPRSPKSPKSPRRGSLWSHRRGDKDIDPFAAAMVKATQERGRERSSASQASSSYSTPPASSRSRKGSRSLSPMRSQGTTTGVVATTIGSECLKNNSGGGRKWRLKDLLLFRSASEGRVTGNKSKDPLRKYTIMSSSSSSSSLSFNLFSKKGGEDSRNSSFRSTESSGSSMTRSSVSAHEMHYKSNRAAAEEMKKKTALPFNKHGLFGCLRFNPAVNSIAKGFHDTYSFDRRQ